MLVGREKDWPRLLAEYNSSNESMQAFCKRHGINRSALYYHLAKEDVKPKNSITMLPVVSPETKCLDSVELLTHKGMVLRFSPGASARYLADLTKAFYKNTKDKQKSSVDSHFSKIHGFWLARFF